MDWKGLYDEEPGTLKINDAGYIDFYSVKTINKLLAELPNYTEITNIDNGEKYLLVYDNHSYGAIDKNGKWTNLDMHATYTIPSWMLYMISNDRAYCRRRDVVDYLKAHDMAHHFNGVDSFIRTIKK